MKVLKPMRWSEGMFLRPQHFQQFDLYLENREYSRFRSLETFGWGLLQLEIDQEALSNFVFKISGLRAVLPDGSLIDVPGNARIGARQFDGLMKEVGASLDITLGVRARDDHGPQTLATEETTGDARFVTAEEDVYDLEAGRDPAPLEKLCYNLRVFIGQEPTDGYETLPIIRLSRSGDVARPVALDTDFSPPALVLAGSPVLHDAARAVVERLTRVVEKLGQKRGGSDPDPLILYYGLSGSLPVLKDMVQEGQVHPRSLYHELVRLAGALLYRDKMGRSADIIPRYDHRDPAPVFIRLRELIFELSEAEFEVAYRRCPMVREGDQYGVVLPSEAKASGARFFLELSASEAVQILPMKMMTARISNPGRIEFLRTNALPGVPAEAQPAPPPELPRGQTGTYYRLKSEAAEWASHVAPAGEMAVFIMDSPADLSINLVVVLPGG